MPTWHHGSFARGGDWHRMAHEAQGDHEFIVGHGKRILINSPKIRYAPEQRLAAMDAEGTDVQVVSIHTPRPTNRAPDR